MFRKKSIKHLEIINCREKGDLPKGYVACNNCGVVLEKEKAQTVKNNLTGDKFYCSSHKQPYDEMYLYPSMFDIPNEYYKRVRVDSDGKPLKQ